MIFIIHHANAGHWKPLFYDRTFDSRRTDFIKQKPLVMQQKISNLQDLFIEQGRELYDVSKIEQRELPHIQKQATSPQLKKVLDRQLSTSKTQSGRLQQAFKTLNVSSDGEQALSYDTLIKHTKDLINRSEDGQVRDAVIVNSVQKLNHNKISSLGSLESYAKEIGQAEIANWLHDSLKEEKAIDQELSTLALSEISKKASAGVTM